MNKPCPSTASIIYDADYFLYGKQSGKSLYENYSWKPDLTLPMVRRMVEYVGIEDDDKILDYGCARGYTVRAFGEMGYDAWGYDVSDWAIDNADPLAKPYLSNDNKILVQESDFDWIIAKDVLEHIPQAADTISLLMSIARKGMFAIVPLGNGDGHYEVPEYELDVTHIHRLTLADWVRMFARPGWELTVAYCVPGIKDNYAHYPMGNGFITARRIK